MFFPNKFTHKLRNPWRWPETECEKTSEQ